MRAAGSRPGSRASRPAAESAGASSSSPPAACGNKGPRRPAGALRALLGPPAACRGPPSFRAAGGRARALRAGCGAVGRRCARGTPGFPARRCRLTRLAQPGSRAVCPALGSRERRSIAVFCAAGLGERVRASLGSCGLVGFGMK